MTFDIHYHTILTKKLPFAMDYFIHSMGAAHRAGLEALVITDHADSLDFDRIRQEIAGRFERRGDAFLVEGVMVFPGIEVEVAEGGHILVAAPAREIDELYGRLAGKLERETAPAAAELVGIADDYDRLLVYAHPFRPTREIANIPAELHARFDALDLNGKDLYEHGAAMKEQVLAYGEKLGIPVLAGSDTHHYLQAGCVRNRAHGRFSTVAELRDIARNRRFTVEVDSCHAIRVEAAQTVKHLLKRQGATAGAI